MLSCLPLHSSAAATSPSRHQTSTLSGKVQAPAAPASFDSTRPVHLTPRNERRRPLVAFHKSISPTTSIEQPKTPSPAPIFGSLQRSISLAPTPPEPPGTLIPNLVTEPPSGFRKLHSRTRSCETISYTPRASLKPHGSTQVRLPTRLRHLLLKHERPPYRRPRVESNITRRQPDDRQRRW